MPEVAIAETKPQDMLGRAFEGIPRLLEPTQKIPSGASSLLIEHTDPRLGMQRSEALSEFEGRSPALQTVVIVYERSLLQPIADLLSGRAWLNVKGLDPAHASNQYERYGLQMAGAGPALIPYREPTIKFSRNIIVSYNLGRYPYQTEPIVAVNPTDNDNIIIGLDDYNFYGDAVYATIDGGETWEGPIALKVLMKDEWGGNPALAFSRSGEAYFSQMSIGYRWVRVANIALIAEFASIPVYKSSDGGFTWSDPAVAAKGDAFAREDSVELLFLDRPWIAVGPDPESRDRDNIYVTYTEFAMRYPILKEYPYVGAPLVSITIKLVRSTDGGLSFSRPVAVSPTYTYQVGEEEHTVVQGSQMAIASDGTLYVSFYDSQDDGPWEGLFAPTITWSKDGGQTFSKPVAIDYKLELDYWVPPTFFRAWPSMAPRIAVGPEGNVYSVVAVNPLGSDDSDIYFYKSLDAGKTWSRGKRINDDLTERDQLFQSIAVSGNGTIHVSFMDRRDDMNDVRYHIYHTKSGDQGESWTPNARVSDYPSNPNFGIPVFIGDYFTMAVSDEDTYIAWTDTRLGRLGSPNSCIAFARMRPVHSPSILISPPSGSAGSTVTIMGFNFASNRELYIEVEGAILTALMTNKEGGFTATLFIPVSGEGAHTIRAMDVSGNMAEATFYTAFGFNSLQKELQKSTEEIESRLSSFEGNLSKLEMGSTFLATAKSLQENLTSSIEELKRSSQEAQAGRLDSLEKAFDTRLSDIVGLLWLVAALAIVAVVISTTSLALLFKRFRRSSPEGSALGKAENTSGSTKVVQ